MLWDETNLWPFWVRREDNRLETKLSWELLRVTKSIWNLNLRCSKTGGWNCLEDQMWSNWLNFQRRYTKKLSFRLWKSKYLRHRTQSLINVPIADVNATAANYKFSSLISLGWFYVKQIVLWIIGKPTIKKILQLDKVYLLLCYVSKSELYANSWSLHFWIRGWTYRSKIS